MAEADEQFEDAAQTSDDVAARPGAPEGAAPGSSGVPQRIGHYHVRQVLASGGMGTVYLAMQEHPRRTVALKVMKPGIASRSTLRRFEYESQILARLRHPNIAQVYEAGTHDDGSGGVPFFAMEYVARARPITEYARERRLSKRQRLELFAKVCAAVHHGHQKGIIHRDLKPGNILVDANGEPKIIDFGVARATDSDLALTTVQTDLGQLVGTVQYMSPEQCEADPHDLDIRSDVYALGVVLFELLCDELPYNLARTAVHEAARIICEDRPARPSTFDRSLRGDIETITLKAMDKDRDRRYLSAADLGQDIRRYLDREPIAARPPSLSYQMRMFARRNRMAFAAISAVVVVLIAGVIGTSWGMVSALRAEEGEARHRRLAESQRDRAQGAETLARQRQAQAEQARTEAEGARDEAARQAAIAEAVNSFLNQDLLAAAAPERSGRDVTVREVLDNASASLGDRFADAPLVEASIRSTLGLTYMSLGLHDAGEPHLERAWQVRRATLGPEDATTLTAANDLARLYRLQGRLADAEALYVATLEMQRRVQGPEHPDTLSTMNNLAVVHRRRGRTGEAEALFVHVLETRRRLLGDEHPSTIASMNNLGVLYRRLSRFDEAEPLLAEAIDLLRRTAGPEHPQTLTSMQNLSLVYLGMDRADEAESLLRESVEVQRRVLGDDHPGTLLSLSNLASLCRNAGRLDEAQSLFLEALEGQRASLGPTHPATMRTMNNVAGLYARQGADEESEAMYRQALEGRREVLGDSHPDTLNTMSNLAGLCRSQDRLEEALELIENAVTRAADALPEGHPRRGRFLVELGLTLQAMQRYERAESALLDAHVLYESALGPSHRETHEAAAHLAGLYEAWGRAGDAATWRDRSGGISPEPESG